MKEICCASQRTQKVSTHSPQSDLELPVIYGAVRADRLEDLAGVYQGRIPVVGVSGSVGVKLLDGPAVVLKVTT